MVALGELVPKKPLDSPPLPMKSLEAPSYNLAQAARHLSYSVHARLVRPRFYS
jgi:hypothetical protein